MLFPEEWQYHLVYYCLECSYLMACSEERSASTNLKRQSFAGHIADYNSILRSQVPCMQCCSGNRIMSHSSLYRRVAPICDTATDANIINKDATEGQTNGMQQPYSATNGKAFPPHRGDKRLENSDLADLPVICCRMYTEAAPLNELCSGYQLDWG